MFLSACVPLDHSLYMSTVAPHPDKINQQRVGNNGRNMYNLLKLIYIGIVLIFIKLEAPVCICRSSNFQPAVRPGYKLLSGRLTLFLSNKHVKWRVIIY